MKRLYGKKVHSEAGQKEGQYGWSQEHRKSMLQEEAGQQDRDGPRKAF